MQLNKERFMQTEFGGELERMITAWDQELEKRHSIGEDAEILKTLAWCQVQWEVYRMAIKHFYGVEYHFTRTDEYYGLCTEDEIDWLMKVDRVPEKEFRYEAVKKAVQKYGVPQHVYTDVQGSLPGKEKAIGEMRINEFLSLANAGEIRPCNYGLKAAVRYLDMYRNQSGHPYHIPNPSDATIAHDRHD